MRNPRKKQVDKKLFATAPHIEIEMCYNRDREKEPKEVLETSIKEFKQGINYILTNLIPEDRIAFLRELGEIYIEILLGKRKEVPINFWQEWYDVAEFEEDKEGLEMIAEMEKAYEDSNEQGMTGEDLCQLTGYTQ